MVVETAVAAIAAEGVAEAAVAEVASEVIAESSISGAAELDGILSAIEKEIPREIVNKQVDAALQDTALRSELVPQIETKNQHLEGTLHPETDVPFESKWIETSEGYKEGVFPDFSEHVAYETRLPDNLHEASDSEQIKYCNEQLRQDFENGGLNPERFSERQQEQIRDKHTPEKYTWHHHEDLGRMQLVPSDIHEKTGHTGGRSLWGGGREAR